MVSRRGRLPHQPVPVEIWSADGALKVKLDAALWLRTAARHEVDMLLTNAGPGAGAGAILIRFFEPLNDELEIVAKYAKEAETELCLRVDRDAVLSWVRTHRTDLAPADRVRAERPARGALRRGHPLASTE